MLLRHISISFAIIVAGYLPFNVSANKEQTLQDLNYGAALFDLYQQRYYSAAVFLDATLHRKQLRHHQQEAELLLGTMMLYYGMHQDAEAIFIRHANQNQQHISDRAWFYMAKLRYQRGLYQQGLNALFNISQLLPEPLQSEREQLHSMLLMALGKYQLASDLAESSLAKQDLFAQYNTAVAMQRSGQDQRSIELLQHIIKATTDNSEQKILQRKARVVLAQFYMQQQQPELASQLLVELPFEGVFADQTLIHLAWAYYQQGDSNKALAAIQLLKERGSYDIQAKEGWLLEGYILEQAEAHHEAKKRYDSAIVHYQREIDKVDAAIESLNDGRFLGQLLPQLKGVSQGWGWQGALNLPDDSGPYVAVMLARYQFYESLQNLRDIKYLQTQLHTWQSDMPSYQHMLKLRQTRYNEFLPLLALVKGGEQQKVLERRYQALSQKIDLIERQHQHQKLLDDTSAKQLKRLENIEALIEKLPAGEVADKYQQRYLRVKGALEWQLSSSFKQRIWQRKKQLRELNQTLQQVASRRDNIAQTQLTTPQMFEGYAQQINEMSQHMEGLIDKMEQLYTYQEQQLLALAADALIEYRNQLEQYRDQAFYRVAHIKDLATQQYERGQ